IRLHICITPDLCHQRLAKFLIYRGQQFTERVPPTKFSRNRTLVLLCDKIQRRLEHYTGLSANRLNIRGASLNKVRSFSISGGILTVEIPLAADQAPSSTSWQEPWRSHPQRSFSFQGL